MIFGSRFELRAFCERRCRENLVKLQLLLSEKHPLLIFVNKGIEVGTDALTLEIIADTWGPAAAKAATFIVSALPSLNESFLIRRLVWAILCEREYATNPLEIRMDI